MISQISIQPPYGVDVGVAVGDAEGDAFAVGVAVELGFAVAPFLRPVIILMSKLPVEPVLVLTSV